jgi:GTP 3',8-cyclase
MSAAAAEARRLIWSETPVRSLRVSVTDRCNFRCRYCMPSGGVPKVVHSDLLSLEELADLVTWLVQRLGIERIKLTGGEPLVRRGINELVQQIARIPGVHEVSLTTNGSHLQQHAAELKAAGLARVNVSLDSLDPDRFHQLTRGGRLQETLSGIAAAIAAGLTPLKLNSVLQRSTWKQDIPALLDYAAANGLELRFIELMRTGTARPWCDSEYIAASRVQLWLSEQGNIRPTLCDQRGPARPSLISWRGTLLSVGWITPRSHPFCSTCDRLRLDARGRLYRCLMDAEHFDIAATFSSSGYGEVEERLADYLAGKGAPLGMDNENAMSLIGG